MDIGEGEGQPNIFGFLHPHPDRHEAPRLIPWGLVTPRKVLEGLGPAPHDSEYSAGLGARMLCLLLRLSGVQPLPSLAA